MATVALEPASGRSHAELAALFTAGYEGYFMPVAVDEGAFSFMAGTWDYDLDASLVAVDGNDDVGLCMLGVRGTSGWIGGVGVVAGRRGEGIGEQLMRAIEDRARSRGIEQLWLEVLVQNEPAIRLYEKLGYQVVRELEVWSLDGLVLQSTRSRRRRSRTPSAGRRSGSPGSARTPPSSGRTTRALSSAATARSSTAPATASRRSCRRPATPTRSGRWSNRCPRARPASAI